MSTPHQNRSSTIFSSSSTSAGNTQSPATATMGSGPNLSISSNTVSSNTTSSMVAGGSTIQTTSNLRMSTTTTISHTNKSAVVLQASLKKLKTMKKKYFVLYRDTKDGEARLEYYDSEKKFKAKAAQPKRKILLKNAVIVRRLDTKHKCVVAIHNENESFDMVFDSEPELTTWYRACVAIQRGEEISDTQPKSTFEHVWRVYVQKKGLAADKGITGSYNVRLTEKALSLTHIGPAESRMPNVEFLLMTIRCCGAKEIYFYMEVGRHSAIGSGELWMETEDALIAENMYTFIFKAMSDSSKNRDDIQPVSRIRSSSESSKPIPVKSIRQSHTGNKPLNMSLSPTGESPPASCSSTTSSTTSNSTLIQFPSNSNNSSNNNNNSNNTKNATIFSNNQDNPVVVNPTSTNFQSNQQQQDLIKNHHVLSAFNCATNTATSTTSANTFIKPAITSCNPQYPSTAPLRPLESQRRHSVSVGSTVACHQRAFSLPSGPMLVGSNFYQNNNNNSGNNKTTSTTSQNINNNNNNNNNLTAQPIQPVHQRTRSLPLSEETAIQLIKPSSSITMNNYASLSSSTSGITSMRCSCLILNKIQNTCTIHNNKSCSFLQQQTSNSHHNNNNIYNYNLNNNLISNNNNNNNNYELNNNINNKSLPPSLSSTSIISKLTGNMYSATALLQSPSSNVTTSSVTSHHHIANSMDSIIEDNDLNIDEIEPASNTIPNSSSSDEQGFSMIRSLTKSATGIKMSSGASPSSLRRCRNASASWSTMGRERCDSLPTRNRTASESSNQSIQSAMPPPRTIHSNRPHSMYINRLNHSPPQVNSSPLSPSGTCSESDGSSFSIDETDGMIHSMISGDEKMTRGGFGQISGATVIMEENPDDIIYNERPLHYDKGSKSLVLPISQNQSYGQRKGSPAPRIGSIEGNNYMDMYSPCSTSPGDPTNAYMSMLPGSPGIDYSRGIYTGSSGAHSRASSIAEDPIDGYVPMLPPQPDDYVDMDQPPHRNYHHHPSNSMSSAASSCSITSGTPSTDMRFAEYHLDKVTARFTPDDEDQSSITERPIRAYSVGSKLEHNKRKFRVEILTTEYQNSRVRAFSVGSRAKVPRSDLYRGILTPSQTTIANTPENTQNVTRGKKSSSAPILTMKSGNSLIDPMDDLMEIDYSKKDESCSTPISNAQIFMAPAMPIDVDDLMEIDFSDNRSSNLHKLNTPTSSLPVPVPNSSMRRFDRPHLNISPKMGNNFSGYVEMRPQMHTSDPVAIAQKNNDHAYLNMRPIGVSTLSKSPSLSSSPIKSMNSPKTVPLTATLFSSQSLNKSNYAEMSSRSLDKIHAEEKSLSASSPKTISDEYLNMKPGDMDMKSSELPKTVSAPEGYMEMGWGKESRTNTSTANEKPTQNYMNVGFSRLASSQPITIRPSGQIYSTFANSNATNTSPGKTTRVRCDSKDSGIVTPSGSQAAIFPFSPSSPMKNVDPLDRKCFVDGTTGTIRLSEEDEQDYMKSNELASKNQTPTQVDDLSSNYATMTIDKKKITTTIVEGPDYVNVLPATGISSTPLKAVSPVTTPQFDDDSGDYTFVDPRKIKTQTSVPNYQVTMKKSVLVTVNNNQERMPSFGGFKPISSNADERPIITKLTSDVSSLLNRQLSEKRELESDQQGVSGYEILQVRNENKKRALSRPNSVNSEKISSKNSSSNSSLNRPNSANSDRIPFISTSTSSSTLCGSSSSSSTLCGSKSQSPSSASTTPRPQSLGDIGTSRPESVTSLTDTHITSRPPSVSLERELHYASLDLPPCDDSLSVKNPLTPGGCESSSSASPSPSIVCTGGANSSSSSANSQQSAFTYAQIDFVKITKQSTKSN